MSLFFLFCFIAAALVHTTATILAKLAILIVGFIAGIAQTEYW